jgi:hypothetical protein
MCVCVRSLREDTLCALKSRGGINLGAHLLLVLLRCEIILYYYIRGFIIFFGVGGDCICPCVCGVIQHETIFEIRRERRSSDKFSPSSFILGWDPLLIHRGRAEWIRVDNEGVDNNRTWRWGIDGIEKASGSRPAPASHLRFRHTTGGWHPFFLLYSSLEKIYSDGCNIPLFGGGGNLWRPEECRSFLLFIKVMWKNH